MKLTRGLGQLTYCTNIHAGEPLDEVLESLAANLPGIRAQIGTDKPLGVGLRLGAQAAADLSQPAAMARMQTLLRAGNYYVFTLNGFPYGAFHGQTVKDGAYRPDWADPERLRYTNQLADILAQLLAPGEDGTISTVPGSYKPWGYDNLDQITSNLVRHVGHLVDIRRATNQFIALALEPEPLCLLETIDETVRFFSDHLLAAPAIDQLVQLSGLNRAGAEQALREHLTVCYDVCHAAVEYEDARQSIAQLRDAGITIGKLQLSSALRIANLQPDDIERISSFDEPVYLHQVVQQQNGRLSRFADIPDAVGQAGEAIGAQWRIHFHVPVFLENLPSFGTTQAFLAEVLSLHRQQKISDHLEVETYTWDVLPQALRSVPIDQAIGRELNWVLSQLEEGQ